MYNDVDYARDTFDSYMDNYSGVDTDGGPVDYETDRIMSPEMNEYYQQKYADNGATSVSATKAIKDKDRISKIHWFKVAVLVPFVVFTIGMTMFMGFMLFAHVVLNVGYWGNGHMPPNHFISMAFFSMVSFAIATIAAFKSIAMRHTGWVNRLCMIQALFFVNIALPLLNN